jgi:hypothetical protein
MALKRFPLRLGYGNMQACFRIARLAGNDDGCCPGLISFFPVLLAD